MGRWTEYLGPIAAILAVALLGGLLALRRINTPQTGRPDPQPEYRLPAPPR